MAHVFLCLGAWAFGVRAHWCIRRHLSAWETRLRKRVIRTTARISSKHKTASRSHRDTFGVHLGVVGSSILSCEITLRFGHVACYACFRSEAQLPSSYGHTCYVCIDRRGPTPHAANEGTCASHKQRHEIVPCDPKRRTLRSPQVKGICVSQSSRKVTSRVTRFNPKPERKHERAMMSKTI